MNTARSDDFIRNRIKNGKEGVMPAFGKSLSDSDLAQIVAARHITPQDRNSLLQYLARHGTTHLD
jgi:mono/diheme cytochrome c family protein